MEVYSHLAFPLGEQKDVKADASDFRAHRFFTIRARVFNVRPIPTTLRFDLWVQPPHANCKTQKSSVDDLLFKYDKHTTGAQGDRISKTETVIEEMPDLEKQCRTALGIGDEREGWLRFVLPNAGNPIRKDIELITLAIEDSFGGVKLVCVPRSEWYESGEFTTKSLEEIRNRRYSDKAYGG